ncbi:cation-transporting P-type ATPase, partial [Streptococcus thermophilus]|nr:cation-transporting P-type ATPase [Streptococcus thermophilus]
SALRNKVFSIELLVSIAVIGAFIIGEFNESAIVTFLFLFGSYLESKTLQKTRTAIKGLTDMSPTTATLVTDDGTEEVDV